MDIDLVTTVLGRDGNTEDDPNRLFKDTLTFYRDYKGLIMTAIATNDREKAILKDIFENKRDKLESFFKGCDMQFQFRIESGKESFCLVIEVDKYALSEYYEFSLEMRKHIHTKMRDEKKKFDQFASKFFFDPETKKEAV
jgi:protease II